MTTKVKYFFVRNPQEVGEWLDRNCPNPPLPDPQRWTITDNRTIEFNDENDAMMFGITFGDGNPPQRGR